MSTTRRLHAIARPLTRPAPPTNASPRPQLEIRIAPALPWLARVIPNIKPEHQASVTTRPASVLVPPSKSCSSRCRRQHNAGIERQRLRHPGAPTPPVRRRRRRERPPVASSRPSRHPSRTRVPSSKHGECLGARPGASRAATRVRQPRSSTNDLLRDEPRVPDQIQSSAGAFRLPAPHSYAKANPSKAASSHCRPTKISPNGAPDS